MASATGATEVEVVRAFLAAMERQDTDAVLALASDDITYQNVPLPPARGRDAFAAQMQWFARNLTSFEARIDNIAADGPVVLTERVDVLARGRVRAAFWVCGTFEVRDGKVVLWRDRFDYADLTVALVKGLVRGLLPARDPRPAG